MKKSSKNSVVNKNITLTKIFEGHSVKPLLLYHSGRRTLVARFQDGSLATKNGKYVNYRSL